MSHRLTREDIKRDEVMEGLSRVAEFVRNHGRALALGIAGLLAVLAGYAIWQKVEAGRQVKANEELTAALDTASTGGDVAQAKVALEAVAEKYGSTPAGSIAYAYLGTIAARAGALEDARSQWNEFLSRHENDALAASVERNLISLDRAEGKSEELAERLRAVLANGSSALGEDSVLFELARTLEDLGQVEGAREIYARLLDEHPTSAFADEARERSSALAAS
jgi:predicted negative regulator of RcsB-dependent stress response